MLFHLFASRHHHVCNFVRHNHDERQVEWDALSFFVGLRLKAIHQFFFTELVVAHDMTDARFGQQRVPLFHFFHCPCQNRFGLPHVSNHRMHEVWQSPVTTQFDHLGVDHQHPNFVRTSRHEHGSDDGIQANAFTGSGSAGDQQVRHGGKVNHERIAGNVFAEEDRDLHL